MQAHLNESQAERQLLSELERGSFEAFVSLYKMYGEDLLIFAYGMLKDRQAAMDIVDRFFIYLLEPGKFSNIEPPIYKHLIYRLRGFCELENLISG